MSGICGLGTAVNSQAHWRAALKAATHSAKTSVKDWDQALQALCNNGEMRRVDAKTSAGRVQKWVYLLKEAE